MYNRRVERTLADEAQALDRAIEGDATAFGELVERHQEAAFRAAYLIVRDGALAEDVTQEAFIRAYRALRTFRRGEPFRPWMLRITTNVAINELRARSRRAGLLSRFAMLAPRADVAPEPSMAEGERSATLALAINELPLDDRVVLYLRYFLELPEREIATAIGRPTGTVKSRLHRASKRLRELIETKYPQLGEAIDG